MIKKTIFTIAVSLLGCVLGTTLTACSSDDEPGVAAIVPPAAQGTFTDPRDGTEYGYVSYGGLDWMTTNYAYDVGSEHCSIYLDADEHYDNPTSTRNLAKYGRLYDLKGAQMACPEGWRLPTDADWQRLEQALGMSAAESAASDWRGNVAFSMFSTKDRTTPLNLLLGGYRTTNINMGRSPYRFMGVYGYYWTASVDDIKEGGCYICRKVIYNSSQVCRLSTDPAALQMSVRYVRDTTLLP